MFDNHLLHDLIYFWGKASPISGNMQNVRKDNIPPIMHPLLAHSLDVAAVASCLIEENVFGLNRQQIAFLVSLHDIGKILPGFQAKVPECYPENILGKLPSSGFLSGRHTSDGLSLLSELSEDFELFEEFLGGLHKVNWKDFFTAIAGHHGQPVTETDIPNFYDRNDLKRAKNFIAVLFAVFQPEPLPKLRGYVLKRLMWRLNQITILSDWIGSRQEWFPYVPAEELLDPLSYYQKTLKQAESALKKAGLASVKPTQFTGISSLFPHIHAASPVQKLLSETCLPDKTPCLAIIEDMTGSGKTEAALLFAQRLMAEKSQKGLFVALPTMATANAMYERLKQAYHRLFDCDIKPSLALAHGKARFEEGFTKIIAPEDAELRPFYDLKHKDEKGENIPAEAFCTAWLASETRRSLLAQIGVGTIDQALLSVLPVRFATLRQAGLVEKILIIDECHAFDAYMNEEMQALLRFHAAMGGSAILLSATLKRETRQNLINAFCEGLGQEEGALSVQSESYPLVTLVSENQIQEEYCAPRFGLSRSVPVCRAESLEAVFEQICQASEKRAAIAWIRNTVDDVIASARALREKNIEVQVFHARFAMGDRLEIEKKVLKSFGKESKGEERAGVLLASQVIEQSLDLDFDLLCSDLAPIDLLIQRAGRLWRHERSARPLKEQVFLVLSPEPVSDPKEDWMKSFLPGSAAVYRDPALLWKTARILFERGEIRSPEDIRNLIESVGSEENIPPALLNAHNEVWGKNCADKNLGKQNVLNVAAAYKADTALWEKEIKTPTRLESEPHVIVRLAIEREGKIIPWIAREKAPYTETKADWALSEVSVSQKRLALCPPPLGLEEAVKKARENWSRFEREAEDLYLLLVLQKGENCWEGLGVSKDEKNIKIIYSYKYGLEWINHSE